MVATLISMLQLPGRLQNSSKCGKSHLSSHSLLPVSEGEWSAHTLSHSLILVHCPNTSWRSISIPSLGEAEGIHSTCAGAQGRQTRHLSLVEKDWIYSPVCGSVSGCAMKHVCSYFPDQGWNSRPLRKSRVLTTGPPAKSRLLFFFNFSIFYWNIINL